MAKPAARDRDEGSMPFCVSRGEDVRVDYTCSLVLGPREDRLATATVVDVHGEHVTLANAKGKLTTVHISRIWRGE